MNGRPAVRSARRLNEAVGEEQNVKKGTVTARRYGDRPTYSTLTDTRGGRGQSETKRRPAGGLTRRFAGLVSQTLPTPPYRASTHHANPPTNTLQHAKPASGTEVTGRFSI